MANSKYEYVRNFERDEILLPNTWIVVRIDGRGFHKLSSYYGFRKPNDPRALRLMNRAATHVVLAIPEITIAYGVSDEYSFVLQRDTTLFDRRKDKIVTTVVSSFTAAYVFEWNECFPQEAATGSQAEGTTLNTEMLPTFDGRAVCYPSWENLRDYLSWRQVDCHINNLYNTTFWALVQQGGMTQTAAEEHLKGTVSSDKNEILWSRFGVNYNNEPEMYRKGSVVFREYALEDEASTGKDGKEGMAADDPGVGTATSDPISKRQADKIRKARRKAKVVTEHIDIIRDEFWVQRPWLRSGKPGRPVDDQPVS
ncbi:tRNA(His) guanylyltransferase [Cladophialophora yegresii CBS 114405]|uniref:tRNA(His) guanylyltransferase n=1 Tax=Cladophialophora yegresii CBS 114405 TaxID=1182544 RepID=W9VHX3_9EURO|nr:tRNA(His) guanylyltransferase [Cladophialophora yegresii CBS 114405]EXJ55093.1 tRNA(His) guanylyltransferase [Cladophialophora yegresii CBS 114405]